MEAGNSYNYCTEGSRSGSKLVLWQNDWHKFKRVFKAASRLNGIAEALSMEKCSQARAKT